MNKYEEALIVLKNRAWKHALDNHEARGEVNNAGFTLQELVDRATPMKLSNLKIVVTKEGNKKIATQVGDCSNCGCHIDDGSLFCHGCGQAIEHEE